MPTPLLKQQSTAFDRRTNTHFGTDSPAAPRLLADRLKQQSAALSRVSSVVFGGPT